MLPATASWRLPKRSSSCSSPSSGPARASSRSSVRGASSYWRWRERFRPKRRRSCFPGFRRGGGAIWRSYIQRSPLFIEDYGRFDLRVEEVYQAGIRSLVFVPVSGERRARIVLVMQDERVRTWSEEDRNVLALVARGLGLMAEQFLVRERMDALLRLEREVLGSFIDEAY
ncbi:GAF domain-containing protein [Oceanithermus sp.]